MKTVLAIIAEARDKYTVHECSECTCRKSCDMNAYGFDTPECKAKVHHVNTDEIKATIEQSVMTSVWLYSPTAKKMEGGAK